MLVESCKRYRYRSIDRMFSLFTIVGSGRIACYLAAETDDDNEKKHVTMVVDDRRECDPVGVGVTQLVDCSLSNSSSEPPLRWEKFDASRAAATPDR